MDLLTTSPSLATYIEPFPAEQQDAAVFRDC
jgi:hypothetical protein